MKKTKKITINDVAKHANVSKSTVSQYLNERFEYMGEKTKDNIQQSIEELGYAPNFIARSLTKKKTSTIGIIVANILHGFSTQVIRSIEDSCNEKDIHVIVCNADDDPVKEKKYLTMLQSKQVDGFIIFPSRQNTSVYQQLLDYQIPVVFMDRIMPEVSVSTILLDNYKAAELAVEHFSEKGHDNIAIVTPKLEPPITPRIERLDGFRMAMDEFGKDCREEFIFSGDLPLLRGQLNKIFKRKVKPTAILASNDLALIALLEFCKEKEMRLPEELSIIGIDEVSFAVLHNPGLTTINQPAFEMGKQAAELLLAQINDHPTKPEIYRYEPRFAVRSSVSDIH
ncbi:LacI family DNA-binding transcriptional regulator [Alteribacillus sp. HJP-4]|uniref:LacI family DNA-binding transcriptional regulator n=1 Tax=Alteribacillus sp. HJP-4 TaxID=2775394 RepID=UPI0035CCE5A6